VGKKQKGNAGVRANVLGMPLDKLDMIGTLQKVEQYIQSGAPHQIITANAEIFYRATGDDELRRIINRADLVLADGAGLVWASGFVGDSVPERVAGIDLMTNILELAARAGYKVFLLGSAPGVADKAADALKAKFPTLNVVGTYHGYFSGEEEDALIAKIKESGAQILFVALGAPRAEKWISANYRKLNLPIMMGVGGSFDIYAGVAKRAPKWMQEAGLEWSYRLLMQPSRAGRMLALPKFVLKVLSWKVSGEGDK
jgi:N-acetylglucosaminyldiphosphoundecaprenol N-acetyl-beta-D-mannosaminyltransferase